MPAKKIKYLIGIDEVGRGPLAGPVTVAAVILPKNYQLSIFNFQKISGVKLKDSKKLSVKQREKWRDFIIKQKIPFAITNVSPKIIDKINVSRAANLAASRAFSKLVKNHKLDNKNYSVFLDGGLYLNSPRDSRFIIHNSIIRGDEKIPAISLASIIAKVNRDKLMKRMHQKYPQYDFINNVGYGTKKHFKAIKKLGISSIHRRSFLKKLKKYDER